MRNLLYLFSSILILQIFFTQNVLAERTITTYQPYYKNYIPNNFNLYQRGAYSSNFYDINAVENYAFSKTYPRENILNRLERLEMQAFGTIQDGDIYQRYENVKSVILSRPKQNYRTSLLRNLGDYFTGQITGFTPQIQNYSNYNSGFTNIPSSFGHIHESGYSNPWGSRYRVNNYGTGNFSGVRILD